MEEEAWTIVQSRSSRGVKEAGGQYQHRETDTVLVQESRIRPRGEQYPTKDEPSMVRKETFRTMEEQFGTGEELSMTTEEHFGMSHNKQLSSTNPEESSQPVLSSRGSMSDKIGRPIKLYSIREGPTAGRKQQTRTEYNDKWTMESRTSFPGSQRGILRIKPGTLSQTTGDRSQRGGEDSGISLEKDDEWPTIFGGPGGGVGEEGPGGGGGGGSSSWSAVVQSTRQPFVMKKKAHMATKGSDVSESDEEDELKTKKKSKRKKKKKKGVSQPEEQRLDQPLMLEFGSMFDALTDRKSSAPKVVVASGGAVPLSSRNPKPAKNKLSAGPRNVLDSNAPVVHRGKERETPKVKKPTALRKVIQREKDERKRLRDLGEPIPEDLGVVKGGGDGSPPGVASEDNGEPLPNIHNRKFREYCTHTQTEDINTCVQQLLSELVRFQDRQYLKDPIKAKARRRYVCGIKEVTKHLKLRKLKCVIIPPNLDRIQSTGGINDLTEQIISLSNEQGVPAVFAMSRRRLAFVLKKKHKIGCVGIFSYDGAELLYKKLMQLIEEATEEYQSKVSPQNVVSPLTDAVVLEDLSLSQQSSSSIDSLSSEPEEHEHGNGMQSLEHGNGTQSLESVSGNGTPSQQHRNGTPSQEYGNGTPVSGKGTPSQEHGNGMPSQEHRNGTPSQEHGNGTPSQEHRNGTPSLEHGNGTPLQEHGNGTPSQEHGNETRSKPPIMSTPWGIFFTSKTDSAAATSTASNSQKGSDISKASKRPEKHRTHKPSSDSVRFEVPSLTQTVAPIPGDMKSRYHKAQMQDKGIPNDKATGFEFNVFANEFQPSFKFDLNINAPEFTPTGGMEAEFTPTGGMDAEL